LFPLEHDQLLAERSNLQAEAVSADEERTAIGDHRENEGYHPSHPTRSWSPRETLRGAESVLGPSFDDPHLLADRLEQVRTAFDVLHIENRLRPPREQLASGASSELVSVSPSNGRRAMSAAARKRISDAQRKRWAAEKKGAATKAAAAAPKKAKRRLSPEGRRRIIEATKKRWAAVRAAASKSKK
jgi:hypothetical protein